MRVYVLLVDADRSDGKRHQSLGSVHSTPEGAMARVAAQYSGVDIRWERHDSHGESWTCKFYRAPFWYEFAVVTEEVQTFVPDQTAMPECPHIHVTEKVSNGGNYGHYGTQRCLDCGAVRDDYSDWKRQ